MKAMTDLSVTVNKKFRDVSAVLTGDKPGCVGRNFNDVHTKIIWLGKCLETVNQNVKTLFDVQFAVLKNFSAAEEEPEFLELPSLKSIVPVKATKLKITDFPESLSVLKFPLKSIDELEQLKLIVEADVQGLHDMCEYLGNKFPSAGKKIENVCTSVMNFLFDTELLRQMTWLGTSESQMKAIEQRYKVKNPDEDFSLKGWLKEERKSFHKIDTPLHRVQELVTNSVKWSFTSDGDENWGVMQDDKLLAYMKLFLQRKYRGSFSTDARKAYEASKRDSVEGGAEGSSVAKTNDRNKGKGGNHTDMSEVERKKSRLENHEGELNYSADESEQKSVGEESGNENSTATNKRYFTDEQFKCFQRTAMGKYGAKPPPAIAQSLATRSGPTELLEMVNSCLDGNEVE
jgi:Domain of unknown function (DUF4806)